MNNKVRAGMGLKIMVMFLIVIIIPMTFLGVMSYLNTRTSLVDSAEEYASEYVASTRTSIDNYIDGFNRMIEQLSVDDVIIDFDSQSEEGFEKLEEIIAINPDLAYVYLGTVSGNMNMRPDEELPEGYDPRIRPWYEGAVESGEQYLGKHGWNEGKHL